jgi:hypothetical protein
MSLANKKIFCQIRYIHKLNNILSYNPAEWPKGRFVSASTGPSAGIESPRGLVSGLTTIILLAEANLCIPLFMIKLSSVDIIPD